MPNCSVEHAARSSAPELSEAVQAQIEETRAVLRADAAAAGTDPGSVDAALDSVVGRYAGARVLAFLGILVEREVREQLQIRRQPRLG